ncbi:MAG: SDR family oxidoreductase [Candidatus Zixiibacteriota bacterium]|nr:MAG: SDR family oxidoreductase [candidate division Zixibacteria bacterium]
MSVYLVVGGAGFIGSNLVEALLERGHTVRVIDNFATGRRENLEPFRAQVELFERDITQARGLEEAFRGVDYVLLQAALPSVPRSIEDPVGTFRTNVEGTLNVLEAARAAGVRKLVFASSSSIYGSNPELPKRETMLPAPMSPYAAGKLAAETYCRVYHRVYGLPTTCLRYFNVFGPRQNPASQYAAVIPLFITAGLHDREVTVYGDGEQSRDFTYVSNVVQANLLAAENPAGAGGAFNAACGDRITLNGMLAMLEQILGRDIRRKYVAPRPGDVPHSQADITLLQETFSYKPQISFHSGLQRTFDYFKDLMQRDNRDHSVR